MLNCYHVWPHNHLMILGLKARVPSLVGNHYRLESLVVSLLLPTYPKLFLLRSSLPFSNQIKMCCFNDPMKYLGDPVF